VTFGGVYANQNVVQINVLATELLQGGGPTIATRMDGGSATVTEIVKGSNALATTLMAGNSLSVVTTVPGGGVNEQQTLSFSPAPTGGSFTLNFDGQLTAPIPFFASAASVQAALVALSNLGPGDVAVSGAAGGPWTVTFQGALTNSDVVQIVAFNNELQRVTNPVPGSALTLTYSGQRTALIPANATSGQVQAALEALSNINPGDVAVSGAAGGPWNIEFIGPLADQDVVAIAINDLEIQRVALPPSTTGGTFTLTFGLDTTTPLPFDTTGPTIQAALEALGTINPGDVVVSGGAGGP
jgi:hypothetical protein